MKTRFGHFSLVSIALWGLVMFALMSSGCASLITEQHVRWAGACYPNFKDDVMLIGQAANHEQVGIRDCGMLFRNKTSPVQKKIIECGKQALIERQPFMMGYVGFGDDSGYCHVAVHQPGDEWLSIYFDKDVTGSFDFSGRHSALWVSKCKSHQWQAAGSVFDLGECKQVKELTKYAVNHQQYKEKAAKPTD